MQKHWPCLQHLGFGLEQSHQLRDSSGTFADDACLLAVDFLDEAAAQKTEEPQVELEGSP